VKINLIKNWVKIVEYADYNYCISIFDCYRNDNFYFITDKKECMILFLNT
jgi:hypothetical protein